MYGDTRGNRAIYNFSYGLSVQSQFWNTGEIARSEIILEGLVITRLTKSLEVLEKLELRGFLYGLLRLVYMDLVGRS